MGTLEAGLSGEVVHPVRVHVQPAIDGRNRLTTAFRVILALPHLLLVGGPVALALSWSSRDPGGDYDWTAGGGVLGAVAAVCAIIAWFAIVFTARFPETLYDFGVGVLRWNIRVEAYLLLLDDAYPPFSLR